MNVDKLIFDAFLETVKECKRLELGIVDSRDISGFETSLTIFNKVLKNASANQKEWLKDMYISSLNEIRAKTLEYNGLRSLHDKIFVKALECDKAMRLSVTTLFENFIKGLTYFAKEQSKTTPIYHRLYSCGPHSETHRLGNLVCSTSLTEMEIGRRRILIERCYIERLIYDQLYIHETLHFPTSGNSIHQQNAGHLYRLDLTRKDFESCFPDVKITVEIEYQDGFPYSLIVQRKDQAKKVDTYLKYYKTVRLNNRGVREYEDIVTVVKIENGKTFTKTNTFAIPGKFTL